LVDEAVLGYSASHGSGRTSELSWERVRQTALRTLARLRVRSRWWYAPPDAAHF
jgi:hypothetical protein